MHGFYSSHSSMSVLCDGWPYVFFSLALETLVLGDLFSRFMYLPTCTLMAATLIFHEISIIRGLTQLNTCSLLTLLRCQIQIFTYCSYRMPHILDSVFYLILMYRFVVCPLFYTALQKLAGAT